MKPATPRAGKFSEIKSLSRSKKPAAPSSEVRAATQRVIAKADEADFNEDAEAKIERRRYADIVVHMNGLARNYHSVGVFVEAMLRELLVRDDVSPAARAAAATWALNLLSDQSTGGAMEAITECLLPALYCHYDASRLDYASPAIQLQVGDQSAVRSNPIFTHSMFVEQVNVDQEKTSNLSEALARAARANDARRDFVIRTINASRHRHVAVAFKAWRSYVRRVRILRLTNEKRSQRTEAETSRLCIRAAFYEWKTTLELSRNSFLTERLHESAIQLENAKNQFQLQCYRADKLVQTTKQAKEELDAALRTNEALRGRVAELEALLVQREKEYNEKLAQSVSESFRVVRRFEGLLSALVDSRPEPERYLHENLDAEIEETMRRVAGEDPDGDSPAADSDELPAVDVLLRWCNSVLHQVDGAEFQRVRTFGADFASGVQYMAILSYVFPDKVPVTARQALNTESLLRRIRDISESCGLRHSLEPIDFVNECEDRIFLSLAELYQRQQLLRERAAAEATMAKTRDLFTALGSGGTEGGAGAALTCIDEAAFQEHIQRCDAQLDSTITGLMRSCSLEQSLKDDSVLVSQYSAALGKERQKGLPIVAASSASGEKFWRFSLKSLADLKSVVSTVDSGMWKVITSEHLPKLLRENVGITSRLFYYYAGDNATAMNETHFWNFIDGCKGLLDSSSSITRERAAAVFDKVASPQLEAALKQASHGKSALEMQTLAAAARQELDVRPLSESQFVETLVRLSVSKGGGGFVDSLRGFLARIQLPYVDRTVPPVVAGFRERESRYVIKFFLEDLVRVFFFYVKQQENSRSVRERTIATQDGGRFCSLLATSYFTALLDDCEMLTDSNYTEAERAMYRLNPKSAYCVSSDQVRAAVAALQQGYPHIAEDAMNFQMFLESFAVLCHYWCADPLVPQPRKMAAFIADVLRQLGWRHSKSTLVLSAPPEIPLEGGKQVDFLTTTF